MITVFYGRTIPGVPDCETGTTTYKWQNTGAELLDDAMRQLVGSMPTDELKLLRRYIWREVNIRKRK